MEEEEEEEEEEEVGSLKWILSLSFELVFGPWGGGG
jgi:hypothetical protein